MADIEEIKQFFSNNDRFAKHSGIRLVNVSPGRAVVEMEVQDFHLNGARVVHGGALFTLADFAFAVACIPIADRFPGWRVHSACLMTRRDDE